MLPCNSSVIDHRWHQIVVKNKIIVSHEARAESDSLSHLDIICDLLLNYKLRGRDFYRIVLGCKVEDNAKTGPYYGENLKLPDMVN